MALQAFYTGHFKVVGDVLFLADDVLPAAAAAFDQAYAFTGGAHDYTADAAWSPTEFPDAATSVWTDVLGDDAATPPFYVATKDHASACVRTIGGALRLTAGAYMGDLYPWATPAGGPTLVLPLPVAQDLAVTFTLRTNIVGNAASYARAGLVTARGGALPAKVVEVQLLENAGGVDEVVSLLGNSYAGAALAGGYTAGGVTERTYRLTLRGALASVKGSAAGSTDPSTLIHGRANGNEGTPATYLAVGASDASNASGLYVELANLRIAGRRWLI